MESNEKYLDGVRVLCVDDYPDSLAILDFVLGRHGAHVTTCSSAEQAIAVLVKERFDVVVSDLSMPPGLDGYDLAHALRKLEDEDPSRQATPTVAVSGDALRPSRKRRFADFQVYMQKPFNQKRLVLILARLTEAEGEVVKAGSLGLWEAEQAAAAAVVATKVATTANAAAVEAAAAANEASTAADDATTAAVKGKIAATEAEARAALAASKAPNFSL